MRNLLFLTNWQSFSFSVLFSLWFLCLSLCWYFSLFFFFSLSFCSSLLIFHTLVSCLKFVIQTSIPYHRTIIWLLYKPSFPVPSPQPWCILLPSTSPSPSSVTPASGEGLLLQDNAVSAEIRALLSSYYNDRWSNCDEKLPDLTFYPHKMPLSHVTPWPTTFKFSKQDFKYGSNLLYIQWIIHKLLSLFYFNLTYFYFNNIFYSKR